MSGNLLTTAYPSANVRLHEGFSSTIQSTLSLNARGVGWERSRLLTKDVSTDLPVVRRYAGFSSTIIDSIFVSGTLRVAWGDENLLLVVDYTKIYKCAGFSASVIDSVSGTSFGTNEMVGLTWDGANVIVGARDIGKIIKLQGFSSSVFDSFSFGENQAGLAWTGTDLVIVDFSASKVYLMEGFSETVHDLFADDVAIDSSWQTPYADVRTCLYLGSTPVELLTLSLYFNTDDTNDPDPGVMKPASGYYYSFWKQVAPYVVDLVGSSEISNVKLYVSDLIDWEGCSVLCGVVSNYAQATGERGVTGNLATLDHPDAPSMVNINNYTRDTPLSLTGSTTTTGKIIDGYVILQLRVSTEANPNVLPAKVIVWEYDEV